MTSFIAKPHELFDRFDPKYVAFKRRAASFRYPAVTMGSLLSEPPEYGAGEAGVERENDATPRYIRITDIDENGELLPGLGMTAAKVEPQYLLSDGDLLFARSGNTVGKCYLHDSERVDYPCFYAGYMIRFRFAEKVLPKYVFAFAQTPYYREWVSAIQRSAGQPNINAQEYRSLELPLPPLPEQRKIVAEIDAAYAAKRAADEKATKLLASIDDMVLNELGIDKLPKPDTSLSSRIFTVPASEVANGRLDPKYVSFLRRSVAFKYPVVELGTLVSEPPAYGAGEAGVERISEQQPRYVRITDIDENGELLPGLGVTAENIEDAYFLRDGDLLFARSGNTVGKTYLHQTGKVRGICIYAGYMIRFRFTDAVLPEYVFAFTQTSHYREWVQAIQRTAGQPNINAQEYLGLTIPLPPMSVQERIASKASSIRVEARKLKADATAALESAKQKIEEELIGEGEEG